MINYTTAAEAAKLIKSNDSVYIQGSVSIPDNFFYRGLYLTSISMSRILYCI